MTLRHGAPRRGSEGDAVCGCSSAMSEERQTCIGREGGEHAVIRTATASGYGGFYSAFYCSRLPMRYPSDSQENVASSSQHVVREMQLKMTRRHDTPVGTAETRTRTPGPRAPPAGARDGRPPWRAVWQVLSTTADAVRVLRGSDALGAPRDDRRTPAAGRPPETQPQWSAGMAAASQTELPLPRSHPLPQGHPDSARRPQPRVTLRGHPKRRVP